MKRRGTRAQFCEYLQSKGIPISLSTLHKQCSPAFRQGPPVVAWIGRRPLYEFGASDASGDAWAEGLLSATPRTLVTVAA